MLLSRTKTKIRRKINNFHPRTKTKNDRTTVPALTLTLAVPRAHAGPTPACPQPPRLPAGQSISTLIALQFTIHRSPPRSGQQLTLTRRPVPRPQRPLNLIPRRGRPLHRAPLRSGRHLKLTRRPARTRPAAPAPPTQRPGLIAVQFTLPRLPAPRTADPAPRATISSSSPTASYHSTFGKPTRQH